MAYFYPVLSYLKQHPEPIIAYGIETGNGGMAYIHAMAEQFPHRPVHLGDWSGFDHIIPAWLIRDAFSIIAQGIDWTQDKFGQYVRSVPNVHGNAWSTISLILQLGYQMERDISNIAGSLLDPP